MSKDRREGELAAIEEGDEVEIVMLCFPNLSWRTKVSRITPTGRIKVVWRDAERSRHKFNPDGTERGCIVRQNEKAVEIPDETYLDDVSTETVAKLHDTSYLHFNDETVKLWAEATGIDDPEQIREDLNVVTKYFRLSENDISTILAE